MQAAGGTSGSTHKAAAAQPHSMDAEPAAGAADDPLKELLEFIDGVTDAKAKKALAAHKDKLLKHMLIDAETLRDTTQKELTDTVEIPLGHAKHIKAAFPDAADRAAAAKAEAEAAQAAAQAAQAAAQAADPLARMLSAKVLTLPSGSDIASNGAKYIKFREALGVRDFRPDMGLSISLMWHGFSEFMEIYHTRLPSALCCTAASDLCEALAPVYTDEVNQMQPALKAALEDLINSIPGLEIKTAKGLEGKPDIWVLFNGVLLLAIEAKLDKGGNAYGQGQKYYADSVNAIASSWQYRHTCLPAYLMEVTGVGVRISALACDHAPLCEPLLHFDCIKEAVHMEQAAHALQALVHSLAELTVLYSTAPQQPAPARLTSLQFPSFLGSTYADATFLRTSSPHLFCIRTPGAMPEYKMVKFVRCKDDLPVRVHTAFANLDLAPPLLCAPTRLNSDWLAVTMAYLDGWQTLLSLSPSATSPHDAAAAAQRWPELSMAAKASLSCAQQQALLEFELPDGRKEHHRIVHGDARVNNVMAKWLNGKWLIVFVDFDWSGRAGVSRYPVTMNKRVQWARGAHPLGLMQQQHDTDLLDMQLEKACKPPAQDGGDVMMM